ncbi:hypothetical protein GUJ93_ZPchr0005g15583 [Zizania palustris]|uniref:Uncharacterized protein n=1 Tax=Zizania palustris TaxID=103762 RepID=A0A8J5SY60_ZIZPA|nr:hypothetical protein GUJ93_ZPchr0005g15583 [Zizania palustris]
MCSAIWNTRKADACKRGSGDNFTTMSRCPCPAGLHEVAGCDVLAVTETNQRREVALFARYMYFFPDELRCAHTNMFFWVRKWKAPLQYIMSSSSTDRPPPAYTTSTRLCPAALRPPRPTGLRLPRPAGLRRLRPPKPRRPLPPPLASVPPASARIAPSASARLAPPASAASARLSPAGLYHLYSPLSYRPPPASPRRPLPPPPAYGLPASAASAHLSPAVLYRLRPTGLRPLHPVGLLNILGATRAPPTPISLDSNHMRRLLGEGFSRSSGYKDTWLVPFTAARGPGTVPCRGCFIQR